LADSTLENREQAGPRIDVYKRIKRLLSRRRPPSSSPEPELAGDEPPAPPELPPLEFDPLLTDATQSGWFDRERRWLFTEFPIGPGDRVLDIGCGDGTYAHFCTEMGAEVLLADVDAASLRAAEERIRSAHPELVSSVLLSETGRLPLPDDSFTRVVAMEVMEHLDDWQSFLDGLVRVGRPGALYLLSVPGPEGEWLQKGVAPAYLFEKPNHINIFEREEFRQIIESAGLEVVHQAYYGFFWTVWWMLFWSTGRELGDAAPPVADYWLQTWARLLHAPHGERIKHALDQVLPKNQIVVARKP